MAEVKKCSICGRKFVNGKKAGVSLSYSAFSSIMMTVSVVCSECNEKIIAPIILDFCKATKCKCDSLNYNPDDEKKESRKWINQH